MSDMIEIGPLAVTMGEPAGIGLEITIAAWQAMRDQDKKDDLAFYLIDDPDRVRSNNVPVVEIATPSDAIPVFPTALPVFPVGHQVTMAVNGHPTTATAPAVIASIDHAVRHALIGEAGGVVTNPIEKQILLEAGFAFPGHTEFLGHLTRGIALPDDTARGPVMMLAGPELRTVPVTVHMSLAAAISALSTTQIVNVATVTHGALKRDFGITAPRLAVSGLNPHAGEQGNFGSEDAEIIVPAIKTLRMTGIDCTGPLPADTMFHGEARARYDAAICMYHDQALIPVKTLDFHRSVNVTLGLPIVRTSPDHGTALNIAGTGRANPQSLIEAIGLAARIAVHRRTVGSRQPCDPAAGHT